MQPGWGLNLGHWAHHALLHMAPECFDRWATWAGLVGGSRSDEFIRSRKWWQVGDAAFCQIILYTCYFLSNVSIWHRINVVCYTQQSTFSRTNLQEASLFVTVTHFLARSVWRSAWRVYHRMYSRRKPVSTAPFTYLKTHLYTWRLGVSVI